MDNTPDQQPLPWLLVIETLIPGTLPLGTAPPLLPEPADPEVGLTTDEDDAW